MPMSHGVNKMMVLPPIPSTSFSPDLFVVLQESPYKTSFPLIRVSRKIMHFKSKTNFFFQHIACRFFDFAVLCKCVY